MPSLPSVIDPTPAPRVTPDQLALIRNLIAKDATPDELKLYLFDCERQGVHPLDKLIHFTKRSGKYTPITSIDFMRIRAAATGECAGIDDAVFTGTPKTDDFAATVTVYRLVQGQRYAFTATARWSEYKPPSNDFMWQRMPHTMLGKCAEALALRKAFSQPLAGLYAKEELDQAIDHSAELTPRPVTDGQVGTTDKLTYQPPSPITPAQQRRLFTIATKAGWDKETMRRVLIAKFDVDSTAAITRDHYDAIVAHFSEAPTVTKIEDIPLEEAPF